METRELQIPVGDGVVLRGNLNLPDTPVALVIFSHGSGSSRLSPRNRFVAEVLNEHHIATLLTDLLTEEEDQIYENRFDIDLLTERLVAVTQFMMSLPETTDLKLGYFGASTGAASALQAATHLKKFIKAVVSRGGRPDMAEHLEEVAAPTFLLVGGQDEEVIELNKAAYLKLNCLKELRIIPGATHLFEEPGKLEEVADEALQWFERYLLGVTTSKLAN
jgi:putative phosphoribosyl transferase